MEELKLQKPDMDGTRKFDDDLSLVLH